MDGDEGITTSAPRGATLGRMSIRGVRSFGGPDEQMIDFSKPLTVISGSNGTGKTTILECLKYATTGQLPPGSSNGQGFVHDPKMANATEVKAQIKLTVKTRATERRTLFVARNMRLRQLKSKMEFKQLEGLLKIKDRRSKDETTLSSKCAELDRMVPHLMGVSSAILNSVIFCHQEESSWPLHESSVLKKKFDDIFDSTRYSKALDEVKKQKKRLTDIYKKAESDKKVFQNDKKTAEGYEQDQAEHEEAIKDNKEKLAEVEEKLEGVLKELNDLDRVLEKTKELRSKFHQLKAQSDYKKKVLQELLMKDAERGTIEKFKHFENVQVIEKKSEEMKAESVKLQKERESTNRNEVDITKEMNDLGLKISELKNNRVRIEERQRHNQDAEVRLLSKLKDVLQQEGDAWFTKVQQAYEAAKVGDESLNAAKRQQVIGQGKRAVENRFDEMKKELELEQEKTEKKKDELRDKLSSLRSALDEAKRKVASAECQLEDLKADNARIERELAEVGFSSVASSKGKLAKLDREIAAQERKVDEMKKELEGSDAKAEVKKMEEELQGSKAENLRKLKAEIEELEQRHDDVQRYLILLDNASKTMDQRQNAFEKLKPIIEASGLLDDVSTAPAQWLKLQKELDAEASMMDKPQAREVLFNQSVATKAVAEQLQDDVERFLTVKQGVLSSMTQEKEKNDRDLYQLEEKRKLLEAQLDEYGKALAKLKDITSVESPSTRELFNKEMAALGSKRRDAGTAKQMQEIDQEALKVTDKIEKKLVGKEQFARDEFHERSGAAKFSERALKSILQIKSKIQDFEGCPTCLQTIDGDWPNNVHPQMLKRIRKKSHIDFKESPGRTKDALHFESGGRDFDFAAGAEVRGFDTFASHLIGVLNDSKVGDELVHAQNKLEEARADLQQFRELLPDLREHTRIEMEKRSTAAAFRKTTPQSSDLRAKARNMSLEILEIQKAVERGEEMKSILSSLVESCNFVERKCGTESDFRLDAETENELLKNPESGGISVLRKKREERSIVEREMEGLRSRAEQCQKEFQELWERLQEAEKNLSKKRNEKLIQIENSKKADEILAKKDENIKELNRLESSMRNLQNNVVATERDLKIEQTEFDRFTEEQKRSVLDFSIQKSKLEEVITTVKSLESQMQPNVARGLVREHQAVSSKIEKEESELSSMKKKRVELKKTIQEKDSELRDLQRALSDFEFLAQIRAAQFDLSETRAQKKKLQNVLKQKGGSEQDAVNAKEQLEEQRREYERQESAINASIAHHEKEVNNLKLKLGDDQFVDIENRFNEANIQFLTTKLAAQDLDKYYKALDAALMQFHSMKIEEINKRISEYWAVMYRGGDIDSIEIRSEHKTLSSRRTYNYRVVMTKGDTILDMRGRCSAGQRVMAALVIRMALAESFSINCGILSVDEPTVNLDENNKKGLANALTHVLQMHKLSKYFQLILITHDTEFVETIAQRVHQLEMEANYYTVERYIDSQSQRFVSRIKATTFDEDQ